LSSTIFIRLVAALLPVLGMPPAAVALYEVIRDA
jgi:uncharacterized membrane protein YesL